MFPCRFGRFISIIKKIPIILKNVYLDALESKLNKLLELGFSKDNIISITITNPYILLYSTESINNKVFSVKGLGYSIEDVIKMMTDFPLIFGYDITNIEKKINFYRSVDLDNYLIQNSKILIYNLDYLKSRLNCIKDKKDNLDLFLSEKDFYNKYNVKSLDLIKE